MNKYSWTVSDILNITSGNLIAGKLTGVFQGISIDSRCIQGQDVFIAIAGERYDGHDFVGDVLELGIKGLIVDQVKAEAVTAQAGISPEVCIIGVKDTIAALGQLGAYHRRRSDIKIIAVTGSNGKTTTRSMIAAVGSQRFSCLTPKANFNNHIGLPLTLLDIETRHRLGVVELGMNHYGEIALLTEMAQPDIGVLTNIGPAHLEGVGSMEGVMRAKRELPEKLGAGATMVFNADDQWINRLIDGTRFREQNCSVSYGIDAEADFRAEDIQESPEGINFKLVYWQHCIRVKMRIFGRFLLYNALAAGASGYVLGLSPEEIKAGLESFKGVKGRLEMIRLPNGITIIDDTYNANPGSMKAALSALKGLGRGGRKIFVAGEMFELGNYAAEMHREVGKAGALAGITRLYAAGGYANEFAEGAVNGGLSSSQIMTGDKSEIAADLAAYIQPGDWILVKGSRSMKMETIVQELMS